MVFQELGERENLRVFLLDISSCVLSVIYVDCWLLFPDDNLSKFPENDDNALEYLITVHVRTKMSHSIHLMSIQIDTLKALDFDSRVILSFRSPFSTLRFSLKIKSFIEQNMFYRSDILHDFLISSF